jgi:tetratricopeptide (TPR) repeat protein
MPYLNLFRRPKLIKIGLRCLDCSTSFTQRAECVYCDLGTIERKQRGEKVPFSEFFVPAPVVCPRCQAADRYDLSSWQYVKASLHLLLMRPGRYFSHSWLQIVYMGTQDGQLMHPYEMRAWYAERVARYPHKADFHLRYANTLRFLGQVGEAEQEYRAVLELAPNQSEALLNLAVLLRRRGEEEYALALLRQLARNKPKNEQQREHLTIAQDVLDGKLSLDELLVGNPLYVLKGRPRRK